MQKLQYMILNNLRMPNQRLGNMFDAVIVIPISVADFHLNNFFFVIRS